MPTLRSPHRARGFNIVEVLAALLVMAVAIIGIAALYSDQTHIPADARLPLRAAELAEEMAERIRSTSEGRDGFATTVGVICDESAKTPSPQDKTAQIAACWEDEVENALPSGLGSISRDTSMTPASYIVAVSWSAPGSGAASYVTRVEIR
ncbi:MAG TPA: type IV pilus modification protein PilV [Steroidobacter sp.]|uniref:type IV pilus modification protein PilV n=1 Tax=Steroidobacter sp. TaxID=1978227 RepID=UPI002EDAFDF5